MADTADIDGGGSAAAAAYTDRVVAAVVGFAETASIVVGGELGWYAALAAAGSSGVTESRLAAETRTHERYAREWLEQQAMAGFVELVSTGPGDDADPASRRFRLPEGGAETFAKTDSLTAVMPMVRMLRAGFAQMPELLHAYRSGGGVPWAQLGDEARNSQADGNEPWFEQRLAPALASVEPVHRVLSRPGAQIADLGCGCGWSTLALARAYPGSAVTGIDIDAPSIRQAQENASAGNLEGRTTFLLADAGDPLEPSSQDAVFIFEALHDMPFPEQVLAAVRRMVKPDGVVVVMDEAAADAFSPNSGTPEADMLERLLYVYSLLVCLPDSMSTPGSAATGTLLRPPLLERYAQGAGYAGVEQMPIEDFSVFRFYQLLLPGPEGGPTV